MPRGSGRGTRPGTPREREPLGISERGWTGTRELEIFVAATGHLQGLVLTDADPSRAMEAAAWTAAGTSDGQGFSAKPAEKVAVEMWAMAAARSYFAELGWLEDQADVDAYKHESFDLVLRRDGEVKHVEVKGTTQMPKGFPDSGLRVFLTRNEVDHARGECKAAVKCRSNTLFILSGITITTAPNEPPIAASGSHLVLDPWNLDHGALEPAVYAYRATGRS